MAKRLAITIAGAVSLGSYEAGVLYELMQAIRTHNERATSEDEKIYVDVLTGASAGGMTAAMVSQCLMYDAAALEGETTNRLYQAWVERISLMGLVKMRWKEKKWHSLFSSDLINEIGQQMLVESMRKKGSGPHAAVEQVGGKAQKLRVGLALTNLDGIDYMIPIEGAEGGGFNYTTSVDQRLFDVTADGQGDAEKWGQMRDTAVACGAFPAAFRTKELKRAAGDYGTALPKEPKLWVQGESYVDLRKQSPRDFVYCDGGVLQNQPLGIAKNLVDDVMAERVDRLGPAAHQDSGDRLYVFVSPHSVTSTAERLRAGRITILGELWQLVHVYTRQAMFHDWIVAEGMNQKVKALDVRASTLAGWFAAGKLDVAAIQTASSQLNALLMPNEEDERLQRLRQQYGLECRQVLKTAGAQAADAFIEALATLEAAADLEHRDKMKIVAVIADAEKELAGSGLAAFVGFFKRSYREHDYWVGRVKTRVYLQRTDVKKILGVAHWPEEDEWKKALPNPSGVTMPVSKLQVAGAAIVPAMIMVLIRPVLVLVLLLVAGLFAMIFHHPLMHLAHSLLQWLAG